MSVSGVINIESIVSGPGALQSVSQDFTTPFDFFKRGAQIPGNERNLAFYRYNLLYEGNHRIVVRGKDFPMSLTYRNWFSEIANFYRDFLLSSPPESTSSLIDDLNRALRKAIVHLISHGVAIIAAQPNEIAAVDPRYFWPLDGFVNGQRYAAEIQPFGPDSVRVRVLDRITTYRFKGDEVNWAYPEGALGDVVEEIEALQRQYFVVALDPPDGIFGTSVFRELLPAVASYTELMSSYTSQLKTSANIVSIKREASKAGSVTAHLPSTAAIDNPELDDIQLAQLYGTAVEGAELSFVSGVVSPESFSMPLQRVEQSIYSTAALSPTLVGQFRDQTTLIQSGVAFTKSFVRTNARIKEIIEAWLPVLTQVLSAAGSPAEITWENPLEALDAMGTSSEPAPGNDNGNNTD